jgi:hypothetical protein
MAIRTRCPECRASVSLPDADPGDSVTCPACEATFTAPVTSRATAAAPPSPETTPAEKKTKTGKKKKKKKGGVSKQKLLIGGGGALVVILALVFLVPWGKKGGGADGGTNAPGGADAPTPTGFVVVDSVPDGPAAAAPDAPTGAAEPRKPVPVAPLVADGAAVPEDGWVLRPDPPAAPPEPLVVGWGVPFPTQNLQTPTFAAMNGPFVAVEDKPVPDRAKMNESPLGRSVVYDLRTGKPDGAFQTGRRGIAFPRDSRLSPDGQWVVANANEGFNHRTWDEGVLWVHKQGESTKPAAEFKVPGAVAWLDFVSAEQVAVYTFDPNPVVCVYTVADGKLVKTIALTSEMHPAPAPPDMGATKVKFWYEPSDNAGAVSPGGRYLVIGGKSALAVVDLPAGKQVAEVPIGKAAGWGSHLGVSFHPDGTELYAATSVRLPNSVLRRLRGWSLATGRRLFDAHLGGHVIAGHEAAVGPPLPGPDPGTMILPKWPGLVVDTRTGVTHYQLLGTPVRWAGPDRLLGRGPYAGAPHLTPPKEMPLPDKDKLQPGQNYEQMMQNALMNPAFQAVYVTTFDRAAYTKKGGETLAAVAPRPPVSRGDRAGLAAAAPAPPAGWTAPPAPAPAPQPAGTVIVPRWPASVGGTHAASITFDYQQLPCSQYSVNWHRHDLTTGKPAGPPVRLWPWTEMTDRPVTMIERFPTPPAAVTDDGKRLAMRDPSDQHRIDVWDSEGKRLGGFVPYDRKTPVEWVAWAGDRLVTIGGGRLTGWDARAGKAVWEVEGGYAPMVARPPAAGWLAVASGENVDLIDLNSGKCLARCTAAPGSAFLDLAVSPDGRSLAVARRGAAPIPRPSGPRLDKKPVLALGAAEFVADVWDLSSGARQAVPFGAGKFGFVRWLDGEHLLTSCGGVELIDRRAGAVVGVYEYAARQGPAEGQQILAVSEDGRLWSMITALDMKPGEQERKVWRTQTLPNAADEMDKLLFAPDREYLRPAAGPLRVEVDLGTEDRSRRAAEGTAGGLRKRGVAIGPKGWALRISHAVTDGPQRLQSGPADAGRPVPEVRFTWRLFAPDGGAVWEGTGTGRFPGMGSRYYTKSKQEFTGGPAVALRTDFYDFGGKDMRTAVVEEILDRAADALPEPVGGSPGAVIRTGGGNAVLPITRTLTLTTGP